jgi:hypothetical protein
MLAHWKNGVFMGYADIYYGGKKIGEIKHDDLDSVFEALKNNDFDFEYSPTIQMIVGFQKMCERMKND